MAQNTIAELDTALADIKDTGSGKVEYDDNSLQLIELIDRNILQERGMAYAEDTDALMDYSGTETLFVLCEQVNAIFIWKSTGTHNGTTRFAATGGGIWQMVIKSASF